MLSIYILDSTAASRNEIVAKINSFLKTNHNDQLLLPTFNLKPITRQELKFNAAPHICILGPELIASEISEISSIKKLIPESSLLVWANATISNLSNIEQMARMGADDIIQAGCSFEEFFSKIILLARKRAKNKSGKLILVDSAKGGLGATTITAGLGDFLVSNSGQRVVLVDLDFETQDLSRFLQIRPFINENLQLILDQNRAVTEESISQSLAKVWEDEEQLLCMTPAAESESFYDSRSNYPKLFLSILEHLDQAYDVVIVDIAGAKGAFLRTLYRVADKVLFIVDTDPASFYASIEKINRIKNSLSVNASIVILENILHGHKLPSNFFKNEICSATGLSPESWCGYELSYSGVGSKWPGSGSTIYSYVGKSLKKVFNEAAIKLEVLEGFADTEKLKGPGLFQYFTEKIKARAARSITKNLEKQEAALSLPANSNLKLIAESSNSLPGNALPEQLSAWTDEASSSPVMSPDAGNDPNNFSASFIEDKLISEIKIL